MSKSNPTEEWVKQQTNANRPKNKTESGGHPADQTDAYKKNFAPRRWHQKTTLNIHLVNHVNRGPGGRLANLGKSRLMAKTI